MTVQKLGLYIHIPFCRRKCFYCDFPSVAGQTSLYEAYCRALIREITDQGARFASWTVDTVFFGGGTPTVLTAPLLIGLCRAIQQSFCLADNVEWTLEANPGTVDEAFWRELKGEGVNRISFGVQSFDDALLRRLGRIHSAQEANESIRQAAAAGFDQINLDLITGLPAQTAETFISSVKTAVKLPVCHLSVYGLTIEPGTVFAKEAAAGKLILPEEAELDRMDDFLRDYLPKEEFIRYEISNYAREGYQCRHNLKYWHYEPYLGLGAAACTFIDGERRSSEPEPAEYIRKINAGISPVVFCERPDEATAKAEMVFLALRTMPGLKFSAYHRRFAGDFFRDYQVTVDQLMKQGLVETTATSIRLTERGKKFGNQVFCAFLP